MNNRYQCQFWDDALDRWVTDCAFHDGDEQRMKAMNYVHLIVTQSGQDKIKGRVADIKDNRIIYTASKEW